MEKAMLSEINRLRQMTAAELFVEWERIFGAPPRATNRQHLFRKLAWELQARAHGGLSPETEERLDRLGQVAFDRATSRHQRPQDFEPARRIQPSPIRDIRMPVPGTVISKVYKGHELTVVVREDGFEFDGRMFASLTAIAKDVTGSLSINGKLFFGLTQRKRSH